MAIDTNSLNYKWRYAAGGDTKNPKSTYAVEFSSGGKNYTFIPTSVINSGVDAGKDSYVLPWFLNKENMGKLGTKGEYVDLANTPYKDKLTSDFGSSTTGFLIPSGSLPFDSKVSTTKQTVKGMADTEDGPAYILEPASGKDAQYIKANGNVVSLTQGKSLLGKVFGGIGDTFSNAFNETLGAINELNPLVKAAVSLAAPPVGAVITAANAGQAAAKGDLTGAALNAAASYGLSQAGDGLLSSSTSGTQAPVVDAATPVETVSSIPSASSSSGGGLLSTGSTGTGLQPTGGLGLTGAGTSAYGGLGSNLGEAVSTAGVGGSVLGGVGLTAGTGAAYGGLGADLGTSAAAAGTGSLLGSGVAPSPTAGAAGATLGDLGTTALIKGGLGLASGLLQGDTNKNAAATDLTSRTALANTAAEMGKFTPVGITTTFGTSNFVTDPKTGAITPSYTLSPTAAGYQKSLSALGNTALSSASNIMNLGNQYINESPEAVRQRYMSTQQGLLAPGQEQQLAGIRTNLANTGRGGLSLGATSDGMLATNPELAAYYNSVAMSNRGIAADAETNWQNQVKFGTGLLGSATTPFTNVFNAATGVETAAQKPLELSTNFANTAASRGAANAANYVNTISPALNTTYNANTQNPWATALSGMSDSDLAVWGLKKLVT